MALDRREFLANVAGGVVASLGLTPLTVGAAGKPRIRAVAFDAFPIFDPRPVFALAETLFPGRGAELSNAWRTRQFEYQWLRALSGRYADFWQTTDDALVFAAKLLQLELSPDKRAKLMHAYLELRAWPDAPSALAELRDAGLRLAFVSNMTARMLHTAISNAGLEGLFARILSTDAVQTYKPDPRAYQVAVDGLGLAREEVLFVAFAGWDAAGAKSFGFPTFWVNRLNVPEEELGVHPDGIGRDLADLVRFVVAPG
jgi:2-haloacid dehalogenase